MASNQETPAPVVAEAASPTCMESVNRIAKLPAVEQTIQTVHGIYEKVKDFNSVTNWTLQTAEDTVHKAVEVGKPYATPVIEKLEGPIKKVDGVLCSGLDYVENKVPAVKLPPKELILQIYNTTKDYVSSHVSPAVETAKHIAEPAVNTAKGLIEPVVENVRHKVDEYLHKNPEQPESEQDNKPSEPKEKPAPKPSKKQS
ncbi:lipid storage droplets surface-binding protein 1-like isoform X3 [Sitophilus oryzae]|nr:lipid storage droplets surface-binding protein 1-like isoform X3 [Sitophilus oryzae]XP_030766555.1 lipid storage droplets surface-binding protein 1-like isoform X3 [Sitophilus oryzae]